MGLITLTVLFLFYCHMKLQSKKNKLAGSAQIITNIFLFTMLNYDDR